MQMPAAESKQNKSKYLKGGHKGERPLLMKPLASTALKTSCVLLTIYPGPHSQREEREATPVSPRCLRPRTRPAAAPRVGTGLAKDNRPPSAPRAGQSQLASKADAS